MRSYVVANVTCLNVGRQADKQRVFVGARCVICFVTRIQGEALARAFTQAGGTSGPHPSVRVETLSNRLQTMDSPN
jgi:hypothetical protein